MLKRLMQIVLGHAESSLAQLEIIVHHLRQGSLVVVSADYVALGYLRGFVGKSLRVTARQRDYARRVLPFHTADEVSAFRVRLRRYRAGIYYADVCRVNILGAHIAHLAEALSYVFRFVLVYFTAESHVVYF